MQNKHPAAVTNNFEPTMGAVHIVDVFPAQPMHDQVYFTPLMPPRGSDAWIQSTPDEREVYRDRREDLLRGIGRAGSLHIADLRGRNNVLELEKAEAIQQSLIDQLTGLENRRALEQDLEEAVAEAHATGEPLDLLFIDLDNFKTLNDTQGHKAGDKMLIDSGNRFSETFRLREGDKVFRIGGDEFVALVRNKQHGNDRREEHTRDEEVKGLMDRIVLDVEDVSKEMNATVSASIGRVSLEPLETAADFLNRADAAMYEDKLSRKAAR